MISSMIVRDKYKRYLLPTALFISILVFYPILFNDFLTGWDDQWMVMNHYTEGGITASNLWAILTEYYHGQYGPVNELMYLSIYEVFGYNPLPFHAASLILHLGSVCMVYLLIIEILKKTTRVQVENKEEIAFLTALIFAIHPMNVEAVAWISAVKILNYTFYYLVATYAYIKFLEKRQVKYYILTIFLFFFSFGGKEQAVTFPVWLAMLTYILGYNLRNKKEWLALLPIFVLAVFFGLVTMWSQAAVGAGVLGNDINYPMWQRIVLGCYSLFEYITKLIVPYNLLYIYPFPITIGEPIPVWMLLYPSLIIIIVLTLWKYISKWPVACGLLFFLIHIAITLHMIPLSRFAIVADRYIYISSIGFAFIIAYYIIHLYKRLGNRGRIALISIFLCVLLALGVFSNIRSREWHNTDSIKKDLRELIKQRPDYVPEEENIEKLKENVDIKNKEGAI